MKSVGTRTQLMVENLKCGGCANTITKALHEAGHSNVTVDIQQSCVEFDTPKDISTAIKTLRRLGYPLIDTEEGLKAAALKAKSYVSCALGKLNSES